MLDIENLTLSIYLFKAFWFCLPVESSLLLSLMLISSYSSMFSFEIIESYGWPKSVFYSSVIFMIFSKLNLFSIFSFYKNGSDIFFRSSVIFCFYNSSFILMFYDSWICFSKNADSFSIFTCFFFKFDISSWTLCF